MAVGAFEVSAFTAGAAFVAGVASTAGIGAATMAGIGAALPAFGVATFLVGTVEGAAETPALHVGHWHRRWCAAAEVVTAKKFQ